MYTQPSHHPECQCQSCEETRLQKAGYLESNVYETKAYKIIALMVEYNRTMRSWYVHYRGSPKPYRGRKSNLQPFEGKMPVTLWNEKVRKWLNGEPE